MQYKPVTSIVGDTILVSGFVAAAISLVIWTLTDWHAWLFSAMLSCVTTPPLWCLRRILEKQKETDEMAAKANVPEKHKEYEEAR